MWQILQYLLLNPENLVAGWRARLYFYSSGTLFKQINSPLLEWLAVDKPRRAECLRKLTDDDPDSQLFRIIADIIFDFIKYKKAPFPGAMLSQEDYKKVPAWKRCLIFIFLFRIVLDQHVTHKYYEWTSAEYNLTQQLFYRSCLPLSQTLYQTSSTLSTTNRYMKRDAKIMEESEELKKLDEYTTVSTRKRRTRERSFVPASQAGPKKQKVKYTYDLTFSDSDWYLLTLLSHVVIVITQLILNFLCKLIACDACLIHM